MEKKTKKNITIIICIVLIALIIFTAVGVITSRSLKISEYSFVKSGLSGEIKILQISDLHYPINSVNLEIIENQITSLNPHFIALTGDIIDTTATLTDMAFICDYFEKIATVYPIYYILGNHEIGHKDLDYYINLLAENHIIFLNNEVNTTTINGDKIAVIGIGDGKKLSSSNVTDLSEKDSCKYSVLLAHRPELFDNYAESAIDLSLTGHTHGGQMRLLGRGFYAPNQGYFPKYSHGLYKKDISNMVVNSGLSGKGRFYNPYEINFITVSKT